jgi:hypothetical protein
MQAMQQGVRSAPRSRVAAPTSLALLGCVFAVQRSRDRYKLRASVVPSPDAGAILGRLEVRC